MLKKSSRIELTAPELIVYNYLTRNKIPFIFQERLLGELNEKGSAKVDFHLIDRNIVIRVQSYWHTLEEARARDQLQKEELTSRGYIVVDVWEDKLKENPSRVMEKAVQGMEV